MAAWATETQIGPYVLIGPIGEGGMGEVWKARDTRIVAIKRLMRSSPRWPKLLKMRNLPGAV